jgi:hypothetical protein
VFCHIVYGIQYCKLQCATRTVVLFTKTVLKPGHGEGRFWKLPLIANWAILYDGDDTSISPPSPQARAPEARSSFLKTTGQATPVAVGKTIKAQQVSGDAVHFMIGN